MPDIREMFTDTIITEFRGKPPEVPLRTGVDIAMLTEGDDNPFFLTLEISTVGRISKNGLLHDEELANTLVKQINAQAAEGIMGHIKETDRSTAFPVSDVHWLGAARHGQTTWAKGYIPRTAQAQREHFRILKATNGRAATSITGPAVREQVDKGKGTWKAKDFQLEQLDLAPFTRAALPPESDFVITRETHESEETQPMTMVTIKDVPANLREQIIQEFQASNNQRSDVAELQTQLTARDSMITELQTSVAEYQTVAFNAALDAKIAELVNWQVKTDDAKRKVDAFKLTLRSHILAQMGAERKAERIAEIAGQVWATLQPLAETVRDALAGPAAIVGNRQRTDDRKLEVTPEKIAEARALFSF